MKYYLVPEETLLIAKKIIDKWTKHPLNCAIHLTEFCDCGLREIKKEYRESLEKINEIKDE